MAKVKVVVTGVRSIDRKLHTLPYRIQGKIVRPAMRKGLKFLEAVAENEVPVLTGATKAAIDVRAGRKRKRGVIEYEVRILAEGNLKKTSARTGKTYFYPAIVQYGSGHLEADPFMSRAFLGSGDIARRITIREIKAGLDREVKASP